MAIIGLILGIGGILLGNAIEGGHFSSLIQFTAALIVFGGTFGAVLISNSMSDIKLGFSLLDTVFKSKNQSVRVQVAQDIFQAAKLARKESILAIEQQIEKYEYPFMREVFKHMIDGVHIESLHNIYEARITNEEEQKIAAAKVWEDAGGYAPTIGIIGAVLGLIHVMANLTDTSSLGQGIAVAFVATIYGVGAANLIFLPIYSRMKREAQGDSKTKEMVLDGAISILNGLNPYLIEEKMLSYTQIKHVRG